MWANVFDGQMSTMVLRKLFWPAMGDSEKDCCCTTCSTDAATKVVDRATLRRSFSAIQLLDGHGSVSRCWHTMAVIDLLQEQLENLEYERGPAIRDLKTILRRQRDDVRRLSTSVFRIARPMSSRLLALS